MGWSGIKNGELLARATSEFDAFISVDKNLQYQQNLDTLPITVIVLDAKSNELPTFCPSSQSLKKHMQILCPAHSFELRHNQPIETDLRKRASPACSASHGQRWASRERE
jgi:hypothetical protein